MSTFLLVSLLLGSSATSLLLWAFFLRIGLRWAKVPEVTTRQVAFAAILIALLQLAMMIVSYAVSATIPALAAIIGIAELIVAVLLPFLVIMRVFKASFPRAVQAWLPTLISPLVMVAIVLFVVRPFLIEAFVSPTNAMAPSLLGNRWQGTCVECSSPAFCSPIPEMGTSLESTEMICRNFHISRPTDVGRDVLSADKFVVAKCLRPRRWDIVVFRFPRNPSELYVMRLVGLPGEEIQIKDGMVWANGTRLQPPESLRGINYLSELTDGFSDVLWGSPESPAKLGDDEYFVLGDFSAKSYDSRLWDVGAPGHNPFAVPQSHLHGVVTHTYWPPSRWRAFR